MKKWQRQELCPHQCTNINRYVTKAGQTIKELLFNSPIVPVECGILANRLAPMLPGAIGAEQAGFVLGRILTYNLQTLFGTMQYIDLQVKVAAVVLDAEKAFDSVECGFLRAVLCRLA